MVATKERTLCLCGSARGMRALCSQCPYGLWWACFPGLSELRNTWEEVEGPSRECSVWGKFSSAVKSVTDSSARVRREVSGGKGERNFVTTCSGHGSPCLPICPSPDSDIESKEKYNKEKES